MITRDQIDLADTVVAYDPATDENWTLDELVEHANGCEEQIDYLWARIKELESRPEKTPEERLVAVYRALVDFVSTDGLGNRKAAETLAPYAAPILARRARGALAPRT